MKVFLALAIFMVAISSCKKNNCSDKIIECPCIEKVTQCFDGYIFWGGSPLADGAGWYFSVSKESQSRYHIENPPDAFKVDGIAVNICLAQTIKPIICGMCVGQPPNYYEIKEIKKR